MAAPSIQASSDNPHRPFFRDPETTTMATYRVFVPERPGDDIRIACDEHGETARFEPGFRSVAFHCHGCGREVELSLRDTDDWRELTEWC